MSWLAGSPGARLLEQTTDVAIEARGGTLPQLFDVVALVTMALRYLPLPFDAAGGERTLLRTELEAAGTQEPPHELDLAGHDTGTLLVHWLRELNHLAETERFVYTGAVFRVLGPTLNAVVTGVHAGIPPLRELKGVTYHELVVAPLGEEWVARISYDL